MMLPSDKRQLVSLLEQYKGEKYDEWIGSDRDKECARRLAFILNDIDNVTDYIKWDVSKDGN